MLLTDREFPDRYLSEDLDHSGSVMSKFRESVFQEEFGKDVYNASAKCACGRPLLFYLDEMTGEIKRGVRCRKCVIRDLEAGFSSVVQDTDGSYQLADKLALKYNIS